MMRCKIRYLLSPSYRRLYKGWAQLFMNVFNEADLGKHQSRSDNNGFDSYVEFAVPAEADSSRMTVRLEQRDHYDYRMIVRYDDGHPTFELARLYLDRNCMGVRKPGIYTSSETCEYDFNPNKYDPKLLAILNAARKTVQTKLNEIFGEGDAANEKLLTRKQSIIDVIVMNLAEGHPPVSYIDANKERIQTRYELPEK